MTSRIVIGTPRIPAKPPRRFPCSHPRAVGTNIFTPGGFETMFGQGPGGNEIPGYADVVLDDFPWLNWSDGSPAPLPPQTIFQEDVAGSATPWVVSTASPRTGTYHARQSMVNETVVNRLHLSRFPVCIQRSAFYRDRIENGLNGSTNVWFSGASAVVEVGDIWEVSFYAKASVVTNSNRLELHCLYANFDDMEGDNAFPNPPISQALTTSYALFTATQVVPDDLSFEPHLMFMFIENGWVTNSGTVTIDIDDIRLDLLA